jgi:hypothetical protein
MRVLQFVHSRRTVLGVGLLSILALAGGCSDSGPVASVGDPAGKAVGESRAKARKAQFGETGSGSATTKPGAKTSNAPAK